MPSRYQPLAAYLAALPPETTTVTLPFAAVERIVRRSLPASAWVLDWWSHPRLRAVWRAVGWRVQSVDRIGGQMTVTFERASDTAV